MAEDPQDGRPAPDGHEEQDTAQVRPLYPPVPAVHPGHQGTPRQPPDRIWTPAPDDRGAIPLGERSAEDLEPAFLRHRSRILRKLAILRSTIVPADEPRPSRTGLRELLNGTRLEQRGSVVAWVTEVLNRDLDAAEPRIRAIERGWFTRDELRLPPPGPEPFEIVGVDLGPEDLLAARRWFDACVASMDPFLQDFLLTREYDGGSWHHAALILRRSVPACQRFHTRAREELRKVLRRHSGRDAG